jgi:hypothetical protein
MILRHIRIVTLAALSLPLALFAQTGTQTDTQPAAPPASTTPSGVQTLSPPTPGPPLQSIPPYAQQPDSVQTLSTPTAGPALQSLNAYATVDANPPNEHNGSVYIPLDSWVYPAMLRLYSLGYLDSLFLGLRPYTRLSALHAIQLSQADILAGNDQQAIGLLNDLLRELAPEVHRKSQPRGTIYGADGLYTRVLGISGTPLRDSYHLGQTIVNDYGRPYQQGFNNVTGFSALGEKGRFSLYVRGEYQHSPAAPGYSAALATQILATEQETILVPTPATLPLGPLPEQNPFRLVEANLSMHLLGHEISAGKSDAWLGPAFGGGMAWSDNAENIYSFRINRVEPLHIPLLSRLLGPVRYDFFVGSLKGHTTPNDPWIHAEKLSFHPTSNFEFGFERTVIWGGEGHEGINLHSFLRSFFSISDTTAAQKTSSSDPGARFTAFDMSYRLPFLRHWITFYTDSEAHDDVTPPSAPRRASYRPGLYLSHVPGLPKLDLRVEAVSTDPGVSPSNNGTFNYFETIQRDGYTNKGFILGDWIGREAKGGQAWITWHLSGSDWVQLEYLNKKTPTNFIPGGTTQNQFKAETLLHLRKDLEMDAWVQYEGWKAPIYRAGLQTNVATAVQITWHPGLHTAH